MDRMWRILRKVFEKRIGAGNLRELCGGQTQINDSNDATNTPKDEPKKHGNALLVHSDTLRPDESVDQFIRSILHHAKQLQRERNSSVARLTSFVGEDGEKDKTCKPSYDELKLWCGVLAVSGVLCWKRFLYDKDYINITKLHELLYSVTVQNNPKSHLAVLPTEKRASQLCASPSDTEDDSLSHAASSFATASNEYTAAFKNKLGVRYASKKQYNKAFDLFLHASEQGNPLAHFNLGLCFENGKGTVQNYKKAADCYKKACDMNHKGALYNLALFYMDGIGGLPKDHKKALELLEKASQADLAKAQSYLGIYYAHKAPEDYPKAVSYLERAAVQNDDNAQYHLGVCYEKGLGVPRNLAMAGKMYQAAAHQGNIPSQYNLGVFYQYGLGNFTVDNKEALRYYRMAAEAGHQDALHNHALLSTTMEKNSFKHDLLWSIFRNKLYVGSGDSSEKSMPRCSSTPNIVDSKMEQPMQNDNSLVAF